MKRRSMLRWMIAGSAGLSLPSRLFAATTEPGEEWLEAIATRNHRVFLDIRSFRPDGAPFRKVHNLLRALTEAHRVPSKEIGIAFGASNDSIAHLLGTAVWREFPVGKSVVTSAASPQEAASLTSEPEKWAETGGAEVRELRQNGVRVLACRNSLMRWARNFAAATGETPEAVNEKLIAGLHQGVETVPAMVAAAVLAQERAVAYIAVG